MPRCRVESTFCVNDTGKATPAIVDVYAINASVTCSSNSDTWTLPISVLRSNTNSPDSTCSGRRKGLALINRRAGLHVLIQLA